MKDIPEKNCLSVAKYLKHEDLDNELLVRSCESQTFANYIYQVRKSPVTSLLLLRLVTGPRRTLHQGAFLTPLIVSSLTGM